MRVLYKPDGDGPGGVEEHVRKLKLYFDRRFAFTKGVNLLVSTAIGITVILFFTIGYLAQ